MAVSDGKPRKTTARTKATSAAEWKNTRNQLPLIETPTGKHIRLKRPGMTKFLEAGYLPDSLATVVRKEINSASRKKVDPQKLIDSIDGDAAMELMMSMDRVICAVMVEPPVQWHRRAKTDGQGEPVLDEQGVEVFEDIPDEDRRDDVVYTDEIDQEDKNFIFRAAAGGSTDLARFREESAAVMETVQAITGVASAPEHAAAPGS